MHWKVPGTVPWGVALGTESREHYLSQGFRQIAAFRWMDHNLPANPVPNVLAIGYSDAPFAYSSARIFIGQQTFIGRQILSAKTTEDALRLLRNNNIEYILMDLF